MSLGGGTWTSQNKVLPGAYINFASMAKATAALSDRGFVASPLMLDWGPDNTVFVVTNGDFQKNCLKIFGRDYGDPAMRPLREIFKYARTLYVFRLNGGGVKASNTFCTAKYTGEAGNALSVVIAVNADDENLFDVSLYHGTTLVDAQTVSAAGQLKDNDFVTWKADAELAATAKTPLTDGTNGSGVAAAYQTCLDRLESYSFNVLCCPSADEATIGLFTAYTKRMRDEVGAKFQTVVYDPLTAEGGRNKGDHEGIITVGNPVTDADVGAYGLVYWTAGVAAACAVNRSNTNKPYDGELTVNVDYTQAQLEQGIKTGRFMLHNVNGEVRVLEDINSLVTVSDTKGDDFKSNQTVRVIDQIANDTATLFNTRYLGTVPNDAAGRIALWNDICKLLQALETIRAIEGFDPGTVAVEQGDSKKSVVCNMDGINVVNAMAQLYMSVVIR